MVAKHSGSKSLLLIGCGRHAERNYLPALFAMSERWDRLLILDLPSRISAIRATITAQYADKSGSIVYVPIANAQKISANEVRLPSAVTGQLTKLVDEYDIDKVIVSTDPEFHVAYACWALSSGLNLLLDKPLSAPENLRTSRAAVTQIYTDYEHVSKALYAARQKNDTLVCNILAQRRYHLGFQKILDLIHEIKNTYGVGVTAFQSLHSDGQWRPPLEIISQDYHGYNRGYGKGLHSGYHAVDVANHIVETSLADKTISTSVHANFIYPDDYLAAVPAKKQYELLGSELDTVNSAMVDAELNGRNKLQYGEISGHLSLSYLNQFKQKISAGTISLLHDGVSQRSWADATHKDLYKNGRIRHESHYFASGPLQTIKVIAYESQDQDVPLGTSVGDAMNFDIHVFRNAAVTQSPAYQHIAIDQLYEQADRTLYDPMKDARTRGVEDFFDCVDNRAIGTISDYSSHERTMKLLQQMYESAMNQQ